MATRQTTEYLNSTNGYRTGQRFGGACFHIDIQTQSIKCVANWLFFPLYTLQECDNLWWDAFTTEFFEDDAMLTITFCLEDGPKRYSKKTKSAC